MTYYGGEEDAELNMRGSYNPPAHIRAEFTRQAPPMVLHAFEDDDDGPASWARTLDDIRSLGGTWL